MSGQVSSVLEVCMVFLLSFPYIAHRRGAVYCMAHGS
eukprot:COSAG06_NODE_49207_length_327_cov_0.671053_1_plen_36_part_10